MGTAPYMDAISELQNPSSTASAIAALKHLKNEAIGHIEKKEIFVSHGLVDLISQILHSSAKARGKRKGQTSASDSINAAAPLQWSDEDEARLQAILLLDCLAHGGASFVTPILASSIVPVLFASLSLSENAPRIVIAALKALVSLAEASRYTDPRVDSFQASTCNDELYSTLPIHALAEIIAYKPANGLARNTTALVCRLIVATCSTEHHKVALLRGGILDLLAACLASCYVQQRSYRIRPNPALIASLPAPPGPQDRHLLYSAISSIISFSRYRVARLLYSPIILNIFSYHHSEVATHTRSLSTNEISLPRIQNGSAKSDFTFSKAFPALGSVQPKSQGAAFADLTESAITTEKVGSGNLHESSVINWLVHVVRSEYGLGRLEAAYLLTIVNRTGFLEKGRDRLLALLVVPLIVDSLEGSNYYGSVNYTYSKMQPPEMDRIKERAPVVLAMLIETSATLQKAATEAHAINKVCKLLKSSFEKEERQQIFWSPDPVPLSSHSLPPSCRLGPPELRRSQVHQQQLREGSLLLVAAITEKDDDYRKALTANGIISCIIDSLAPLSEESLDDQHASLHELGNTGPMLVGNTVPVLLAACKAAKTLSRSVMTLRTSLIDAGIAKPIFALLKHSNVNVLIEATNVLCNIITEFSPMRHDLVEAGAIKTLCEHAHSANSEIRLVSLWALKHLVFQSPNDVKIQCFEELGTGWLIQIITGGASSGDARASTRTSNPLAMGVANAAGERVDILNATDEHMDTVEESDQHERYARDSSAIASGDLAVDDYASAFTFLQDSPELMVIAEQHKARLNEIKESDELATALQAHEDEMRIRMQGLDFVRNLIHGQGAADMIDSLFHYLGANRVFDIVESKLKLDPSPRIAATDGTVRLPTNPPDILYSAIFIVVHLAAGAPRHRQQLISQPQLLLSLIPLLSHSDPRIRVSCAWVVCNLTWVDDMSDQNGAKQRALELRRLGFEDVLRSMTNDEVHDVRERVVNGLEQIRKLLDTSDINTVAPLPRS